MHTGKGTIDPSRPIVVIDAGHGGQSSAGRSTATGVRGPRGTLEKDVTLALARHVAERLGGRAVLTRSSDVNLSLGARAALARRHGAAVFLSLHANGGDGGGRGAETYVHARAGQPSRSLATALRRELLSFGGRSREAGSGELAVLSPEAHAPHTAACLLEVDYLSHPHGEARLRDPHALQRLGSAIARGVSGYLAEREHFERRRAFGRGAQALDTQPAELVFVDMQGPVDGAQTDFGPIVIDQQDRASTTHYDASRPFNVVWSKQNIGAGAIAAHKDHLVITDDNHDNQVVVDRVIDVAGIPGGGQGQGRAAIDGLAAGKYTFTVWLNSGDPNASPPAQPEPELDYSNNSTFLAGQDFS